MLSYGRTFIALKHSSVLAYSNSDQPYVYLLEQFEHGPLVPDVLDCPSHGAHQQQDELLEFFVDQDLVRAALDLGHTETIKNRIFAKKRYAVIRTLIKLSFMYLKQLPYIIILHSLCAAET